jgi:uncharacterized protein (TIGR00730 family)
MSSNSKRGKTSRNGKLPGGMEQQGSSSLPHRIRNVCVYCGSGKGSNPAYASAARALGKALAKEQVGLVYGGGSLGLMGEVARATLKNGGRVTGIIPTFLSSRERMLKEVTELIVTEDMHQRKMEMFRRSDAFVALPGGIGTLEELVEQLTWSQLGRHAKPIVLANINGFWSPFLTLLKHMGEESFIRPGLEVTFIVVDRAQDILPAAIEAARAAEVVPEAEIEALF